MTWSLDCSLFFFFFATRILFLKRAISTNFSGCTDLIFFVHFCVNLNPITTYQSNGWIKLSPNNSSFFYHSKLIKYTLVCGFPQFTIHKRWAKSLNKCLLFPPTPTSAEKRKKTWNVSSASNGYIVNFIVNKSIWKHMG